MKRLEPTSAPSAQILYSDRDSRRMRRRRRILLAVAVGPTAVLVGAFTAMSMGPIASAWSNRTLTLQVLLAWTAVELIIGFGAYFAFIHSAWDALRRGSTVTAEALHVSGWTIPIASILRAEIVRFDGYSESLAIDHRGKWFRGEWVWTVRIGRGDTESLERLRDEVRTALGLPPQTLVTESTWREWRRAADAQLRRPARP